MTVLVRTWLALAALGAGVIHLGAAAGSAPLPLLAFAALGAAELAWAVAALARTTLPLPRVAVVGALVPPAVCAVLLLGGTGADGPSLPALVTASALDLVVAAGVAVHLRRKAGLPGTLSPWPYLGGVAAGALLVSGLVIGALATTPVGMSAVHPGGH